MQKLHETLAAKWITEAGGEIVRTVLAVEEWPNGTNDKNTVILAKDPGTGEIIAIDFDDYANGYWSIHSDIDAAKKHATPEPEEAEEAASEAAA